MLNLPASVMTLLTPFRPHFTSRTWPKVQILLIGAILTPNKRTVSAILRVMGLNEVKNFALYHHVFNRAVWSAIDLSRTLLHLLVSCFHLSSGPLVFGIDETLERRWGLKIAKRGIYRDAVRSSQSHFVKASGLRWISLMALMPIPWAGRVWGLPFLTVLAPSERFYEARKRSHKKLTDWARQMIYQLRRWLPDRELVVVADYSYAAIELLHSLQNIQQPVTMITRIRLDAALYEPAPAREAGQTGRPGKKGQRLPTIQSYLDDPTTVWSTLDLDWYDGQARTMEIISQTAVWYHTGMPVVPLRWVLIRDPLEEYEPVALLSTSTDYSPEQIITWFIRRWSIEVTFEEVRAHLGVETQRQWSDKAIERITPLLLGLFSWLTLVANQLHRNRQLKVHSSAWYVKEKPTFSDVLASVRWQLWLPATLFSMSYSEPDIVKVPRNLMDRLVQTVCYST